MSANTLFDFSLTEPYRTADPEYPAEQFGNMAWSDSELDQFIFGSPSLEHTPSPTAAEADDGLLLAQAAESKTLHSLFTSRPLLDLGLSSPEPGTAISDASTPQPPCVLQLLPTTLELSLFTSQLSEASSPAASDPLAVSPLDILQNNCDFTTLFGSTIPQPEFNCQRNQLPLQPTLSTDCTDLTSSLGWLQTPPSTPIPTARKPLPTTPPVTPTPPIIYRHVEPVLSQTFAQVVYLQDLLGLHPFDMTNACHGAPNAISTQPFPSPHVHPLASPILENYSGKRKRSDHTFTMTKYPKLSTAKTPHLGQRSPPNESISHRYQLDQQQRIKRASSKSSGTKKLTDSAHYRARNAFFMFRGFVSRLQCTLPCKSASDSLCPSHLSFSPMWDSKQPLPTAPRPQVTGQPQTKVSVSCGKLWRSECFDSCDAGGCANCRMRSLFSQASDYLKLRQAHIERRIEFHAAGDDQTGPWADIPLEDTFKWTEFQQLYYESDLFKWHRDNYLGQDGVLDVEGLKRIWVENEQSYEKTFTQAARQRTALEISGNRRKIGQGVRRP